jgi:hypothetical protein
MGGECAGAANGAQEIARIELAGIYVVDKLGKSACTMSRTSDITSMRRGVCAKASDIVISCSKALAKISPARLR